jgi:hypothetical protein
MVHPRVRSALQILLTNMEPFKGSGMGYSEFIANAITLYEPDLLAMVGPSTDDEKFEARVWRIHQRTEDQDPDVLCPVHVDGYFCDYIAGHDFGHNIGNRQHQQTAPKEAPDDVA